MTKMACYELLQARRASLQSPAATAREPGRRPSVCSNTICRRQSRRRSLAVSCNSSGPQQWRTVPTHQQYGTQRRPGPGPVADGDGGLPGPVVAAGWVLAAMIAFNFLRAIVLMWVRSQPRRPLLPPTPAPTAAAAEAQAPTDAPASPGLASGADPEPGSAGAAGGQTRPAAAESAPGTSASKSLPATAALTPGLASAASMSPLAPAMEDMASASASVSDRVAAASDSAAAATAAAESGGGSLQVANYQLRPRGSKSGNNLGRVVLCATLDPDPEPGSDAGPGPGSASGSGSASRSGSGLSGSGNRAPWRTLEWHQRFWQPLISKYADTPEERVTGLLLLYGNSVLHVLEGDNNQLFALLRELRPQESPGAHRLQQIRVPCYILDLRERLFGQWMCAATQRPTGRSRALRAALRSPAGANDVTGALGVGMMGVGMAKGPGIGGAAAAAAGVSGESLLPPLPGADGVPGSGVAAPEAPPPDQQLVSRIQQLELFVKFVGPKLSALATQEALTQALRNLHDFDTTTPPEDVVASLATDPLAPALHDFVNSFDADYHRYVSLLAMVSELEAELEAVSTGDDADVGGGARIVARAASLAGEIRHLARFYDEHVKRDLKEAMAQREEERRIRGADEVARRLSRGMRLRVNSE
ncbi:hypothetical protein PLESTB_000832200 [Pleodorina starrii]|uniref:Uncharacterized protein n=1 Tax=Pleodorina starrii TaxID=330485 RepID=A0A9W6F378_9CHLO|nr:hypothetical protein PLESTM_000148100 [Pleodorina starrii]GLC54180.1 hypothetical protein PLESTB_000832200 [Pleodorina starrii]GLC64520.1 hypothetical protein PLESTF_000174800 [Pleodorina starrii]